MTNKQSELSVTEEPFINKEKQNCLIKWNKRKQKNISTIQTIFMYIGQTLFKLQSDKYDQPSLSM